MRRWIDDKRGVTSIEFAIVAPLLIVVLYGAVALTYGIWTWNAIENVTAETARCVAVSSVNCATKPVGCALSTPEKCYASQQAERRGMSGLLEGQIIVDKNMTSGSTAFTGVTITYPYALIGYEITLTSTSAFPNSE